MSISLIRDRVKVEILRDTSAVSRVSFGIPLYIGETDPGGPKAASYANLEEVGDTYGSTDREYIAASVFFSQSPQPRELVIGYRDNSSETYVEALEAIRLVNDTWYAVAINETNISNTDAEALATAVSALPGFRQLWLRTDDVKSYDPLHEADLGATLKAANYYQARVLFHSLASSAFPDMAQLGRVLPIPESATTGPGTAAWFDQPVVGIAGDTFTTTQRNTLEDKNIEFFMTAKWQVENGGT